jgi:cell fate regulator YaaT (PSP1 superfamily)
MNDPPTQDTTPQTAEPPTQPAPDAPCGEPGGDARAGNDVAIVGVRLHGQVRVTQFNSGDLDLEMGEHVVVEGNQAEVGVVAQPTTQARKMCGIGCMKRVLRVATPQDREGFDGRVQLEADAQAYCRELIRKKRLSMKLVQAQRVEETRKITFTFTAEGRVDFRDLVRDLARRFRSRIEMRQIGVRDEARALGGYGDCGRALCCSTFLTEFSPISIKDLRHVRAVEVLPAVRISPGGRGFGPAAGGRASAAGAARRERRLTLRVNRIGPRRARRGRIIRPRSS